MIISSASGSIFPVSMIFFAEVVDAFIGPQTALLNAIKKQSVTFSILGAVGLVLGFLQAYLLVWVADRQAERIRLLYFQVWLHWSLLRQDIAWHERNPVGAILSRMNNNIQQIEEGMGGNLANFFRDMSVFIAGIIVAFVQGWKLTLVAVAMIPLISLVFTCLALVIQLYVKIELQAYSEASSFAAEIFTSVKTVFAFGGEKNASERYDRQLDKAQRAGVKKGILLGSSIGMISVSIFSTVAVLFYYGCTLLIDKGASYQPGTIVLVMMNVVYGSIAVGRAMPLMEFFLKAAGNAGPIFATIDRVRDIEFKNVRFYYPQRPDVEILSNFNLKIKAGETMAIVGPSGSGKSTIAQLIQEHYDPVYLDGIDIRNLDLGWLRKHVGVVSQEPVLFSGSVEHNIKSGLTNATTKEVVEAAKLANAHEFIKHLPEASEGGASISGGQKQRVAIARALIRQPQILLLDESTSALDSYSERLVLAAMEKVRRGRTIIMIAHRLSTVRNADRIIVIDRGQIKEMGTHEELLLLNGIYAEMLSQSVS
ncbi:unnamed protein product [Mesocestoides corti]|uniref:Uncharacterized protein n=1 Tax=Mesocestoides corti TaxID=53468 RepID=A0A3P6GRT2_MESCO|nr:unnamed protein product [Mesocestoides corti]